MSEKQRTLSLYLTVLSWVIIAGVNGVGAAFVVVEELEKNALTNDIMMFGSILVLALVAMLLALLVLKGSNVARVMLVVVGIAAVLWHSIFVYFAATTMGGLIYRQVPGLSDYLFLGLTIAVLLVSLYGFIGLLTTSVRRFSHQ